MEKKKKFFRYSACSQRSNTSKSTPTIAEKNEASSSGNDNDARVNEPNRDLRVTEALRTQIEIQKLLHEQLKVPRCLLVIML
ncbi:hypothetical protein BDE02_06G070600 [Populus trichocarpa]|nr:hypothetical protein BDE02_06G070600 [Populus trichocarpa]